jgi:glycosyltransferase involved in cell wall biosynthesis
MDPQPQLTPDSLEFVLLSFEGPDEYSMAGGLGVRMKELGLELARQGFRTHQVFVGDPKLPGEETPIENLTLHRWSQWLSSHYPGGVYQGEEAKLVDWNEQLPPFVVSRMVKPAAKAGRLTAVLAEEWHTAYATCQLSDRLWAADLRENAIILWNANNVMGFDRINWRRLDFCAQITTVSRYMKHVMWDRAVNPLVIPNGIPADRIREADPIDAARLRGSFAGRELIFKIGRFSPDKRWNMAVHAVADRKAAGKDVAMVIRGGIEPHGAEVLATARKRGLRVHDLKLPRNVDEALSQLGHLPPADVYNIVSFMSDELISLFYSAADAVLANSGHEPFGLVGLEVMAVGGIAFVGSTGEDYAVPFLNSVVLDTDDPSEIGIALDFMSEHPETAARMRRDAQETARSYSWENVVHNNLLGKLEYVYRRQLLKPFDHRSAAELRTALDAPPSSPSNAETQAQPEMAPDAMSPAVAAEVGMASDVGVAADVGAAADVRVAADRHASACETDSTAGNGSPTHAQAEPNASPRVGEARGPGVSAPASADVATEEGRAAGGGGASSGAPAIGAPASDSQTAPVDPDASRSVGPGAARPEAGEPAPQAVPEDPGPSLAYGGGVVGDGLPVRPQLPVAAPGGPNSPVCEFGPSQTGFPQSRVEPAERPPKPERG